MITEPSGITTATSETIRYGRYVASLFVRQAMAGVVAFLVSTGGWLGATDRPVGGWDEVTVGSELHKLVQALAVNIGPRSYVDPANLDAAADFVSNRLAAIRRDDRSVLGHYATATARPPAFNSPLWRRTQICPVVM